MDSIIFLWRLERAYFGTPKGTLTINCQKQRANGKQSSRQHHYITTTATSDQAPIAPDNTPASPSTSSAANTPTTTGNQLRPLRIKDRSKHNDSAISFFHKISDLNTRTVRPQDKVPTSLIGPAEPIESLRPPTTLKRFKLKWQCV